MLLFCNKNLTPTQQRSGFLFGCLFLLTVLIFGGLLFTHEYAHLSLPVQHALELIPIIPVVAMIALVGRYLNQEKDDFVRMMVTQSLLWGLGVTMVGSIVFSVVFDGLREPGLSPLYNLDVFCITGLIALRIQIWRNR